MYPGVFYMYPTCILSRGWNTSEYTQNTLRYTYPPPHTWPDPCASGIHQDTTRYNRIHPLVRIPTGCTQWRTGDKTVSIVSLDRARASASAVSRTRPSGLHCDSPSGQGHPTRTPRRHRKTNTELSARRSHASSEGFLSHVPPSTSACIFSVCTISVVDPIHAPQFTFRSISRARRNTQASMQGEPRCNCKLLQSQK